MTALVQDTTDPVERALRSTLDFTLAPRLDGRQLQRIPEYSLSLLLNQSDDGTHSLTVKTKQFSDAATFDPVELETLVGRARRALRKTAWDSEDAWQEGVAYRYLEPSPDKLARDLVTLGVWGIRFFQVVCDRLAGESSLSELEDALRAPGYVQLALKQSPRHLLPAALIYDYIGLEDTASRTSTRCARPSWPHFGRPGARRHALLPGRLPEPGQLANRVPERLLGIPPRARDAVTLKGAPDAPPVISYTGQPSLSVAVSTDPQFTLRAEHEGVLRGLRPTCGTPTHVTRRLRCCRTRRRRSSTSTATAASTGTFRFSGSAPSRRSRSRP